MVTETTEPHGLFQGCSLKPLICRCASAGSENHSCVELPGELFRKFILHYSSGNVPLKIHRNVFWGCSRKVSGEKLTTRSLNLVVNFKWYISLVWAWLCLCSDQPHSDVRLWCHAVVWIQLLSSSCAAFHLQGHNCWRFLLPCPAFCSAYCVVIWVSFSLKSRFWKGAGGWRGKWPKSHPLDKWKWGLATTHYFYI